ncbi:ArnT family glycosyltransferase [Chloroflexota bacterium]
MYVYIVPPWQHYDEPNHFEYVWAMVNGERDPHLVDDYADFSQQLIDSLIANGFCGGMGDQRVFSPPDDRTKVPGFSQVDEPPLYYLLESLPIRLLKINQVETQLYLGRTTSFLLYIFTILISWGIAREITSAGNPLRIVLPMSLALLPGFTDIMTAINYDVGAVVIFSITLWGGLRLILRGFSITNFLWVIITAVLSFYTKSTAITALIVLPISLLFAIFRGEKRKYAWGLLLISGIIVLGISLSWGDANLWYRSTKQSVPTRIRGDQTVVGEHVLFIDAGGGVTPGWMPPLFQPLPDRSINEIKGKAGTLGAWVWANQDIETNSPILHKNLGKFSQTILVTKEPQFIAFHVDIPEKTNRVWVSISPTKSNVSQSAQIYYDGIVLAAGRKPLDEPPTYTHEDGSVGTWGGEPFVNLIRNGSAERSGFRFRSEVDNFGSRFLGDNTKPSLIITSLIDYSGAGNYYKATVLRLFRTFWSKFGWGHVHLRIYNAYLSLAIVSMLGILGAIFGMIRKWSDLRWDVLFMLGIVLLISWGATFVRGATYLGLNHLYFPVGRNAYPVIIPTMLIFCLGWLEVIRLTGDFIRFVIRKLKLSNRFDLIAELLSRPQVQIAVLFVFFLILDTASLYSIVKHYGLK